MLVYEKFCEVLSNNARVRGMLTSPASCPKIIAYSYVGMYCRYKWFKAFFVLVAIFYLLRASKSKLM